MKLRCKPDQLCRIIKSAFPDNINKIVRTEDLCLIWSFLDGQPEWHCIAMQPLQGTEGYHEAGHRIHIYDSSLEPLADDNDTRKDETLEWLPVPKPEKEIA